MEKQNRPLLITLVCLINFIIILITSFYLANAPVRDSLLKNFGWKYILYVAMGIIFSLSASLGYWYMKRWGVYIFLAIILISIGMNVFLFPKVELIPCIFPQIISLLG